MIDHDAAVESSSVEEVQDRQLDELMAAARLELPGDVWKRLDDAGRL
jgi:hypothetical protein